jgi:cell division septal protein FtsQ
MREHVVTTRTGRVGAGAKGRAGVAVQRPAARRTRPAAQATPRQKSFAWKSALPYVPLALKLVLAVSLGALAFVGYRAAASASFFKVKSVDVEGATRASREDIRAAVLRLSNAGVWQSDIGAIAEELRGLPWVRDAVVTRVLPAGLRVRVTEREPRVIARTSQGKLVWVDDDGVMLGSASPGGEDFFFRGFDEGNNEQARRENRARITLATELKGNWEKSGLSKRVSEVDLSDLRDVRVHLAGEDSGIQIVLGEQDYTKRFQQALEKLDQLGRVQGDQCVTYAIVTSGKNVTFGRRPCAEVHASGGVQTTADASQRATVADAVAQSNPTHAATGATTHRENNTRRAEHVGVKEKKDEPATSNDVVLRPRRVN